MNFFSIRQADEITWMKRKIFLSDLWIDTFSLHPSSCSFGPSLRHVPRVGESEIFFLKTCRLFNVYKYVQIISSISYNSPVSSDGYSCSKISFKLPAFAYGSDSLFSVEITSLTNRPSKERHMKYVKISREVSKSNKLAIDLSCDPAFCASRSSSSEKQKRKKHRDMPRFSSWSRDSTPRWPRGFLALTHVDCYYYSEFNAAMTARMNGNESPYPPVAQNAYD